MIKFAVKRLGYGLLVLLGVTLVIFMLFSILPSAAQMQLGQRGTKADKIAIEKELGLDKPLGTRFVRYLANLSPIAVHTLSEENKREYGYVTLFSVSGDRGFVLKKPYLGRSFQNRQPVRQALMQRLPQTVLLAITAMIFAFFIGIFLGIFAALKQNSALDFAAVSFSVLGISLPSYFSAVLLSFYIGKQMDWLFGLPMMGSVYDPVTSSWNLQYLILPAIALGIRPVAIITQLTRSAMLDTLSSDYVRTAKAKGLSNRVVILKHTLRNALNPVVTAASGWFASLLAGSFFVEYIFKYKGLGYITIEALKSYDLPLVMGSVLLSASFFVIIMLLTDVLYSLLDKRISLSN